MADGILAQNDDRAIAVALQGVGYTYPNGDVEALRDLTLHVGRGRVVGIVGPSGCGKSTLLSLIADLRKVTAGSVSMRSFEKGRHLVTMMFQKDTLLPWLTTAENIKLFYRIHRGLKGSAEIAQLVDELLVLAHLQGFRDFFPYQLSGGMRRRVAFLSTVAAMPEILLLDEPFSSLDEPTRVAIHQDVAGIIRQLRMSVVLVTHDLAEALTLCDEVVILTARPGSVYSRHDVPFGADRNMLEIRKTPEFLRLYGVLWEALSLQIAMSRQLGDTEQLPVKNSGQR